SKDSGVGNSVSSAKCRVTRTVIDVFMLEFRSELSGKIVHLDDDPANAGDKKVVSEHRWNSDAEGGHRGNERTGYAGRHGDEARRSSLRHAGKSVHDPPHGRDQSHTGR